MVVNSVKSGRKIQQKKNRNVKGELKGIAEVFLEKVVENFGQKWKVRNGMVVFQKIFVR